MTEPEPWAAPAPGPGVPVGPFHGLEAFQQSVRDALAAAAHEGWPEIVLSDADFDDWPLGERAVIESLERWARRGRRLSMLACDFDALVRRHPRFVRWRVTWDPIVVCRRSRSADPLNIPSALWSPAWVLQRLDPVHSVGISGREPERLVRVRELLNEWLHSKSTPGFPATTLGL
ncbi:MAG: hypothetical protein PHI55_06785 [Burkholderiaceae bacterium]|nr:hypothetical protein [Burkholderiaceae bacterium]